MKSISFPGARGTRQPDHRVHDIIMGSVSSCVNSPLHIKNSFDRIYKIPRIFQTLPVARRVTQSSVFSGCPVFIGSSRTREMLLPNLVYRVNHVQVNTLVFPLHPHRNTLALADSLLSSLPTFMSCTPTDLPSDSDCGCSSNRIS